MTTVLLTPDLGAEIPALSSALQGNGFSLSEGAEPNLWREADCVLTSPEEFLKRFRTVAD